jgi:hypothetical protein
LIISLERADRKPSKRCSTLDRYWTAKCMAEVD